MPLAAAASSIAAVLLFTFLIRPLFTVSAVHFKLQDNFDTRRRGVTQSVPQILFLWQFSLQLRCLERIWHTIQLRQVWHSQQCHFHRFLIYILALQSPRCGIASGTLNRASSNSPPPMKREFCPSLAQGPVLLVPLPLFCPCPTCSRRRFWSPCSLQQPYLQCASVNEQILSMRHVMCASLDIIVGSWRYLNPHSKTNKRIVPT